MVSKSNFPSCPRCGSRRVTLCGESVEYAQEEWPGQPLQERELRTLAYQCECGLGFTQTSSREKRPDGPDKA
jgi:hypothetical protein